jgi:pectinesterase
MLSKSSKCYSSLFIAYRYRRVIYKNTIITVPLNKAVWTAWSSSQNTANVFYADYNTSGSGISGVSRPSWVKSLSASDAATYTIASAVGSDYSSWVDSTYL